MGKRNKYTLCVAIRELGALLSACVTALAFLCIYKWMSSCTDLIPPAVLDFSTLGSAEKTGLAGCGTLLFIFYSLCWWKTDRLHLSSTVLALLYSAFFQLGACQSLTENREFTFFPTQRYIGVLVFVGLAVFFYSTVELIHCTLNRRRSKPDWKMNAPATYAAAWLVLFLGWLPHYVIFFPGSVPQDTLNQLMEWMGFSALSNNNPVFDTFLFGSMFKIGFNWSRASDNANISVALAIAVQYLIMVSCFALSCVEIRKLTKSTAAEIAALAFYVITPIFGGAAQTLLKDSLHMAVFVVFICCSIELVYQPYSRGKAAIYAVALVFLSITRKGAMLYAIIGGAASVAYYVKGGLIYERRDLEFWQRPLQLKAWKALACSVGLAVVLVLAYEIVLLPALNIKAAPSGELYSMFYQQITYVAQEHRDELTEEEIAGINTTLDFERAIEDYDPNISDPVKSTYHAQNFDEMKGFFKVWLSWLVKYPADWVKGLLTSYWKYVYPFAEGQTYYRHYHADFSKMNMKMWCMTSEELRLSMIHYLDDIWPQFPLLILLSPGTYAWLLLFAVAGIIRNRQYRLLVPLVPLLVLFVGLFMTHVNGEVRYAYPLIAAVPLALALMNSRRSEA